MHEPAPLRRDQRRRRPRARLVAAALALAGCAGEIGGEGAGAPRPAPVPGPTSPGPGPRDGTPQPPQIPPPTSTPPAMPPPGMAPPAGPAQPSACQPPLRPSARPRVWLLTAAQYGKTVATLFSGRSAALNRDLVAPKGLPIPFSFVNASDHFSTHADSYAIRDDELQDAVGAADAIAARLYDALATGSCLSGDAGYPACIDGLVRDKGALLFRRPLTAAEVTKYAGLATTTVATVGKRAATELAFRALLMAPQFLYRAELGTSTSDPTRRRLDGYELAAALSYSLTDGPPDQKGWEAAAGGALADAAGIAREVRRLLGTSYDAAPLARFVREYLGYGAAVEVDKVDAKNHRPADLVRETDLSVRALLARSGGARFVETLLTSNAGFATKDTAGVYGVTSTAVEPTAVSFTNAERVGLLAQPSWLVAHSQPERSDIVRRGRFIREFLLCQPIPEVNIVDVAPIPADPTRTLRDKMIAHVMNPGCQSCHALMDPMGFPFEGFDHFGKARTTEAGKPVDRSGQLVGSGDQDGPVDGVATLMARLARSRTVSGCFVSQTFQFFVGRPATEGDACALEAGRAAYESSGGDLAAVLGALFASDAFVSRTL